MDTNNKELNGIVIKREFNVVEYITIVEEIANGYFDEEGNYIPHYGRLSTMAIFYNECIDHTKFESIAPEYITEAIELENLIKNSDFMREFNTAIQWENSELLNFTNAYQDAMSIVEDKKDAIKNIASRFINAIAKIGESFTNKFDEKTLKSFAGFAQQVADGKITSDTIVDAYIKTTPKS